MARTLVTGASGFIGRHLVTHLRSMGHEIIEATSKAGDIAKESTWESFPPVETVMHLAGKVFVPDSWAKPGEFVQCNVLGTTNALDFCRKHGAKLVFLSSYLYGAPKRLPIPETAEIKVNSPYALSKRLAEEACEFYAASFGVDVTVLRPFNVYGSGQAAKFLIPSIVRQVDEGRSIKVMDLEPKRDYVNVNDLVAALASAGRGGKGCEIYNIGSGVSHSVAEVIALIQEIWGTELPVLSETKRREHEVMDTVADIAKAKEQLGWVPQLSLRAGLTEMFSHRRVQK